MPDRRQSLKMVLGGALAGTCSLVSRSVSGQEDVLIPPAYLADRYIAPGDSPSRGVIASVDEPGERFIVTGRVLDRARPIAGASLYAFHADADGFYTRDGRNSDENARLFATFRTDANGRYAYETIRPGGYDGLSAHFTMSFARPAMLRGSSTCGSGMIPSSRPTS